MAEKAGLKDDGSSIDWSKHDLLACLAIRSPAPRNKCTSYLVRPAGQICSPHWHQGNYQFYVRRVHNEIALRCSRTKQGAARLGLCVTSAQPMKTIEPVDIVLEVESVRNKKNVHVTGCE
jgi:hypothetical protein